MPFRWLFDDAQNPASNCLDQLPYEEWLAFVFDRPVPAKHEERWYQLPEADGYYFKDSLHFLQQFRRLLQEPEQLLPRYSVKQIRQGFWCFISAFELPDILEEPSLDLAERLQSIRALENLYRRLFNHPGFEKIAFLYWDPLAHSYHVNFGRPYSQDHKQIQDAMFATLTRILAQPERISFLSALHGLGHLKHPNAPELIRSELAARPDLSPEIRQFAQACAKGAVDGGVPQFIY